MSLVATVQVDAEEVEAAYNLVILVGMIKSEVAATITEILTAAEPEELTLFVLVRWWSPLTAVLGQPGWARCLATSRRRLFHVLGRHSEKGARVLDLCF